MSQDRDFDDDSFYSRGFRNYQKDMWKKGNYHDPCKGCGGEDCVCCPYGQGL